MATSTQSVDDKVRKTLQRLEPLLRRSSEDPRPVVLMTCGVSGAGKTTLTKAILATHPTFTRLSIDATIAERHGLYGADYESSELENYQDEAAALFKSRLTALLENEREKDIVLDRAFYDKEDRDEFKTLVESLGGRVVLVYLPVPKEELWRRIQWRRERGVDADSAREISWELLGSFVEGFEAPEGEGEFVISYVGEEYEEKE